MNNRLPDVPPRVESLGDGSRRKLLQRVSWNATALLLLGALGLPGIADEVVERGMSDKPDYVTALQAAYGEPSEQGFGSAVFWQAVPGGDDLTQAALSAYRTFAGKLWERYGEPAWMGPWREVYRRPAGAKPDIVAELRGISDPEAQLSVPMILDVVESAEAARAALSATFDDPAVTELRAFNLGDGGAMSGLLVAGRRTPGGESTFLVFLVD
jgi:hypothetical protein